MLRHAWLAMLLAALGLPAALGTARPCKSTSCDANTSTTPWASTPRQPRLSWTLRSDVRGQRQTAYQVLVASSPELLQGQQGDLWDSGRVSSDETAQVVYAGKPLPSRQACFWKVRAWDRDGTPSAWSHAGPLGNGPAAARRLVGPLDRRRPGGRSGRGRRVAHRRPVDLVPRAGGRLEAEHAGRRAATSAGTSSFRLRPNSTMPG